MKRSEVGWLMVSIILVAVILGVVLGKAFKLCP